MDLGDAYLDDGSLAEAVSAYERALALSPSPGWAYVSAAYARALAGGPRTLGAAGDLAGGLDLEARRRELETDLTVYVERLGDPIDPVVSVIRSVAMRASATPPEKQIVVRVRAARPLAPSAALAFAHTLVRCGRQGRLVVAHERAEVALGPLWRMNGGRGAIAALARARNHGGRARRGECGARLLEASSAGAGGAVEPEG